MLVTGLLIASIVVYILAMAIFYRGGILESLLGLGIGTVLIYVVCYIYGILPGVGPLVNC